MIPRNSVRLVLYGVAVATVLLSNFIKWGDFFKEYQTSTLTSYTTSITNVARDLVASPSDPSPTGSNSASPTESPTSTPILINPQSPSPTNIGSTATISESATMDQTQSPSQNKNKNRRKPVARICWAGVAQDWPISNALEDLEELKDLDNATGSTASIVTTVLQPLLLAGYDVQVLMLAATPSHDLFPAFREPYSFTQPATYNTSIYTNNDSELKLNDRTQALYQEPTTGKYGREMEQQNWDNEELRGIERNATHHLRHLAEQLDKYLSMSSLDGNVAATQQQQQQQQQRNHHRHVNLKHYRPMENPPVPVDYLKALVHRDACFVGADYKKGEIEPNATKSSQIYHHMFARVIWRIVNDMRLLHSHTLCGEWVAQETAKAQAIPQGQGPPQNDSDIPDLVLLLGDDVQLPEPLSIPHIAKTLQPRQLLTVPARTTRGHSTDQVEILAHSSSVAETKETNNWVVDFLTRPYQGIHQSGIFQWKDNNETGTSHPIQTLADYLRIVYQSLDIQILTMDTTMSLEERVEMAKIPELPIPEGWNEATVRGNSNPVSYPLDDSPYLNWKNSSRPTSNAIASTSTSPATNKSALICITGQMGRLVLDNKIKTLFQPMHEVGGYDIDLTFVLSPGKAIFQKGKEPKGDFVSFHNDTDILDYLQAHKEHVHNGTSLLRNVNIRHYEPSPNLPVNPQYLFQKGVQFYGNGRGQWWTVFIKEDFLYDAMDRLLLANTKMVEAYQQCYTDEDVETMGEYDLYVRLREDLGFFESVPPHLYNQTVIPDRGFLTHGDKSNGGINDRMAFVRGQQAALCYFHLPFVNFFNGRPIDSNSPNTEVYFKRLYWKSNGCLDESVVTGTKELRPGKIAGGVFMVNR